MYEFRGSQRIRQEIFPYFPPKMQAAFGKLPDALVERLEELRMRAGQPFLCCAGEKEYGFDSLEGWTTEWKQVMTLSGEEVRQTFLAVSEHSRYAFDEDIRRGFLTLPGGHRVGISGQVLQEGMQVRSITAVGGLAFRIARACAGCADAVLPKLLEKDGMLPNVLIVSPPRCGKTTLLRDLCRQLSNGSDYAEGKAVTVVDERSEIAGCFAGIPQLDVGLRTDVLDGCPKAEGMMMALRALSPEVIVTDEISRPEDAAGIRECAFSGISVLTSVHAGSLEEAKNRPGIRELLEEGVFEKIVVLSRRDGPGKIERIETLHLGGEHDAGGGKYGKWNMHGESVLSGRSV